MIAWVEIGEGTVLAEEIAAFTDRADDVDFDEFVGFRLGEGNDFVMTFVKGRTDEVVHSGIDDFEGFGGALFLVEAAGEKDTGVANDVATGF